MLENNPKILRVLVADDHTLVREGVINLLDKNLFEVVGEAADGAEAVNKYLELSPDIILMDLNMPKKSGLEAAREIMESNISAKVVILSVEMSEPDLLRAIDLAVKGYLLKTSSSESLNHALALIANGESVFPADALVKSMSRKAKTAEMGLTAREEEILHYIAKGLSNKEIAIDLDVTEGTIKVHIKAILKKLNMSNRTQAAIYAYEKGLV